jgi:hypothetical protein
MSEALEAALKERQDIGRPNAVREVLTGRIIACGKIR